MQRNYLPKERIIWLFHKKTLQQKKRFHPLFAVPAQKRSALSLYLVAWWHSNLLDCKNQVCKLSVAFFKCVCWGWHIDQHYHYCVIFICILENILPKKTFLWGMMHCRQNLCQQHHWQNSWWLWHHWSSRWTGKRGGGGSFEGKYSAFTKLETSTNGLSVNMELQTSKKTPKSFIVFV